jgi:tetratricopeptide (TPR) repeat protein
VAVQYPDFLKPDFSTQGRQVLLLCAALLVACASTPAPAPPPRLQVLASEAENDAMRHYARGDYAAALRGFTLALRLQQSLDNSIEVARHQLNLAQCELALGKTQAALQRASLVTEPKFLTESRLLQAQANLSLGLVKPARPLLSQLNADCETDCTYRGTLHLLQARAALLEQQAAEAVSYSEKALNVLIEKHEDHETANAWRLMAAAQLALSDPTKAMDAAQAALSIDRKLGLPEKIARDWLLIGDIQRNGNAVQAKESYRRALAVAQAASLTEVIKIATQAMKENTP